MKKNKLLLYSTLAAIVLMAFSLLPQTQNETMTSEKDNTPILENFKTARFNYELDSRFKKTLTKSQLKNAKTIHDLFSPEEIEGLTTFKNVRVTVLPPGETKTSLGESEFGKTEVFNTAQLALLHSVDYSTNFVIEAACTENIKYNYQFIYYISIVPEKKAAYIDGNEAFLEYLKINSMPETAGVDERKLWFGRVNFVVTKDGEIGDVYLESTSGYLSIDKKMVALIASFPGKWFPAKNDKGENIDQELVFSFGKMGGC